jgi:hypothetical protein
MANANETVPEWARPQARVAVLQAAATTLARHGQGPGPNREDVTDLADYYLGWMFGDQTKKPRPMAMDCPANDPEGFGCVFFAGHDGPHETYAGAQWGDLEPDEAAEPEELLQDVAASMRAAGWPDELVTWVQDPRSAPSRCPVNVVRAQYVAEIERTAEARLKTVQEALKILGARPGQMLQDRAAEVIRERDPAVDQ